MRSGTVEWHRSRYGTEFVNSEIASPVRPGPAYITSSGVADRPPSINLWFSASVIVIIGIGFVDLSQ